MGSDDRKVITGEEAVNWLLTARQGEGGKNKLAKMLDKVRAPVRLEFKDVDFKKLRSPNGVLDLRSVNFHFRIYADFSHAKFGDGDVLFNGADFSGGVSFKCATFGKGDLNFNDATLVKSEFSNMRHTGKGSLRFHGASFKSGLSFGLIELGDKTLSFTGHETDVPDKGKHTNFQGKVHISFQGYKAKRLSFERCLFETEWVSMDFDNCTNLSDINFQESCWKSGVLNIENICLSNDDAIVNFFKVDFSKLSNVLMKNLEMYSAGWFSFYGAKFPENGATRIEFGNLLGGQVSFPHAAFGEVFLLEKKHGAIWKSRFSFMSAKFAGQLSLSKARFESVPNFNGASFTTHVNLEGMEIGYDRISRLWSPDPYVDNTSKLQRLKELAENNRDHQLALSCHADEMRSRRWQKKSVWSRAADFLDVIYDLTSNYGQSIARPAWALVASWFLFALAYLQVSPLEEAGSYFQYLGFSVAMAFPFLPVSGLLRGNEFVALFGRAGEVDLGWVYLLMGVQGILSVILLFLIGLGLRNRFRI